MGSRLRGSTQLFLLPFTVDVNVNLPRYSPERERFAMTDTTILTERRGHVLIVTINRPDARNAVNAAVHIGIGTALEEAENDPEIRVVIITGAGDKSFCAGADLVALSRGESLRSEEHPSELKSPMRKSYAVFCLNKNINTN